MTDKWLVAVAAALFAAFVVGVALWKEQPTADQRFGCDYAHTDAASGECK